jgi:hypothetical protein
MGPSKGSPRGKFIAMHVYIKRTEKSQIKDLTLHLKLLKKQEQTKPKTSSLVTCTSSSWEPNWEQEEIEKGQKTNMQKSWDQVG